MNYAGFGVRFLAWLVDIVVLGLVGFVLGLVAALIFGNTNTASIIINLLSFVIGIYYYVFYQQQTGQTLGKKALKIKVVDASGKTPTKLTFFLREFVGKFLSAIILGIGYLMIIWDSKKQGLHDKIASTYVVKV